MSISKHTREQVYQKYHGHCAYCGAHIEYKDMQVDHFIPKDMAFIFTVGEYQGIKGIDDITNLMPSCRMCNHYKRAHPIDTFRRYIEEIPRKLHLNYIYKVGLAYGNVSENIMPITFYFEKEANENS